MGAALTQPLHGEQRWLVALCAAAWCIWVVRVQRQEPIRVLAAVALAAGAAAGRYHPQPPPIRAHTLRTTCTVVSTPLVQNGVATYTCAVDGGPDVQVTSSGTAPRAAEHLLVRGRIEDFDGPRNPGEPDVREIERERGIRARIAAAHILAVLPPAPLTVEIALARAHAWALAQLQQRLPEPGPSILAGELWGEHAALPPELRAEFQETGTVHILITAGLHLGVVAAIVLAALRACGVARVPRSFITIGAVWLFALFSGMHLPAVRAATMLSVACIAHAAGAASRSWNAFGAALLVVTVFAPESVLGTSFALSFSCVGAIMLTAEPIKQRLHGFAMPNAVREALAMTIASQIGTWPLTLATFLVVAPYAIVANLAIVPLVGATMLLAMAQLLCAPVAALAQGCANINGWLLAWTVAAVHTIASLPGAVLTPTPPPLWCIAAYDGAVTAAVFAWRGGARTAALSFALIAPALVLAPPIVPDSRLRITVLDVGQADGIVIQTPSGATLLVDAGGRLELGGGPQSSAERIGERVVVPYLRRAGVHHIDAIVLSHPHGDHAGGVAPVLRSFGVAEFADSGQRYSGFAYNDALAVARTRRVPLLYPRAGAVWRTPDGVNLTFIGPSLPFISGSGNDINDNSIAFVLQYRHFRMLFTGDAGVAAEQRFLREGIDLRADVLKVGHHGSAYSSSVAFIAAVHPKYAVISVGRHNMFGHPAPSTIATLQRLGAHVYRTDENGAVIITSDGRGFRLTPTLP